MALQVSLIAEAALNLNDINQETDSKKKCERHLAEQSRLRSVHSAFKEQYPHCGVTAKEFGSYVSDQKALSDKACNP